MELHVDKDRFSKLHETGIHVKATYNGKRGSYDIAYLDKESLLEWLHDEKHAETVFAENVIGKMLGHGRLHSQD